MLFRSAHDRTRRFQNSPFLRRLAATLRQSPTQSPRRKAAVHSRWCALRATLARIGSASAGGGSSNRYLTRVSVSTTPIHLFSRTLSNACDPELDFPRPEIRCFMNARFFRRHSVFSTCTAARGRDQPTSLSSPLTFHLLLFQHRITWRILPIPDRKSVV